LRRFEITFIGHFSGTNGPLTADQVEKLVDLAVAELEALDAEDIDVSTNLREFSVTVSISLEDEDLPEAQIKGSGTIRTAFHAAGAGTPGWRVDWTSAHTLPEADNHPELAGV
jgi:hypothetical protein